MFCQQCGNSVEGAFCSRCGAAVQAAPVQAAPVPPPIYGIPPMYVPRVPQHIHTLGIMWCVYGGYRAIGGVFGALFLAGLSAHRFGPFNGPNIFPFMHNAPWMAGLAGFVAMMSLVFAALAFAVGFALINRKPWGRTLAIIIAILQLIKIPFGTALGIYTLWVLAPAQSAVEYDAIAISS
jgi:hypothetical protein